MKSMFKVFSIAAVLTAGVAFSAQASVDVWHDAGTGVSASFPDTWSVATNVDVNDVLTVNIPGDGAYASCRISAKADKRYAMYPRKLAANVQRVALTQGYWETYFADGDNVQYHHILDDKGLGRGFASLAIASYETAPDNIKAPRVLKTAMAFASLYDTTLYTVECSSEASVYKKMEPAFLGFVKSVDFKKITNYQPEGYYRDFLDDCILKVRGPNMWDDSYF